MKTTVQISDGLLAKAQLLARKENTTLKALINEGLQKVVSERKAKQKPFKLKDGSFGPTDPSEKFPDLTWDEMFDITYEGRGA